MPATQSLHLGFWVAEDCCIISLLLAVPSCIYSFWHGVIPTSYFIFILVYIIIIHAIIATYYSNVMTVYNNYCNCVHQSCKCRLLSLQ